MNSKKTKTIGFRVNQDLKELIQKVAEEKSLQTGSLVRSVLVAYLKNGATDSGIAKAL